MIKRQSLRARIERLETRKIGCNFPRLTFILFDRDEADIVGAEADFVGSSPVYVIRQPDEPIGELIERAYSISGALSVILAYSAQEGRSATHAARTPQIAPDEAPAKPDPYALASIGRVASRAELERMGAIPLPGPERLI